ncbi:MAG: glycosyltransferase family 9 protein [Crocinitomicaceae bacterium]|nr:glycosyltransferase family 9 protein [Crocinitomicaceae bacterium]
MKILIVRFSSIGDIVLTSPVIRGLKEQLGNQRSAPVKLHYLTKKSFASIVSSNPRVDRVFAIDKSIDEVVMELKNEQYDWVIDLHNNIRTKSLKSKLQKPSKTVRKLNWKKWMLVKFKINRMPSLHIVDRYFETVNHLNVKNDKRECEFYINPENEVQVQQEFGFDSYLSVAIGAQFATKRLPTSKLIEVLSKVEVPIVLIGGNDDSQAANSICEALKDKTIVNACGKYNLQQSASIVKQSQHLLTHDTGMTHIASCFGVSMTTIWGNTVPDLGMYAYLPSEKSKASIHEVKDLSCRPCSKIGFQKCPKGHFKCMEEQNLDSIIRSVAGSFLDRS